MLKLLETQCGICGTYDRVEVNPGDYYRYRATNDLVQNIFPNLTTLEREIVVGSRTGFYVCEECWETDDNVI